MQLIPFCSPNSSDRCPSPKTKNAMTSNPQNHPQSQQQIKMFVNNGGPNIGDNSKRNNQNKPMFNKNLNSTMTNASSVQKNVVTTGTF